MFKSEHEDPYPNRIGDVEYDDLGIVSFTLQGQGVVHYGDVDLEPDGHTSHPVHASMRVRTNDAYAFVGKRAVCRHAVQQVDGAHDNARDTLIVRGHFAYQRNAHAHAQTMSPW